MFKTPNDTNYVMPMKVKLKTSQRNESEISIDKMLTESYN